MKAIFIDSAKREISEVELSESADAAGKQVGGWIEVAWMWSNGDMLIVDEEGMLKPTEHFFRIDTRSDQPLAGNGVIIGREIEDDSPKGWHNEPPKISVDQVRAMVQFYSREQVDAWGKANASEPAVTITTRDQDGKVTRTVSARFGDVIGQMPKPGSEEG